MLAKGEFDVKDAARARYYRGGTGECPLIEMRESYALKQAQFHISTGGL
jgi:hypothetical protein